MTFFDIHGSKLEYVWHGPQPSVAPSLVFLHEGLGSVSMWHQFPARLAARSGCGALVYSRRGYGRSDPLAGRRTRRYLHDEALDVLPHVLSEAGIRESILIGHSDGASIALIYAASGRAKGLHGLVLEAPHIFVEDITLAGIAEAGSRYRDGDLKTGLRRYHGNNVDGAFWGWHDCWLTPAFRDWSIEHCLPAVSAPALVIQGAADGYGTPRQAEAIATHVAGPAETLLLDDCGHVPHRECAGRVLEVMATFIARLVGADPGGGAAKD